MRLEEPRWWYAPVVEGPARWLAPVGAIYGAAAQARFKITTPAAAGRPVVCVGNFTAGGTGKTPLCLRLAHMLREAGREPWFLTRGYGGRVAGPHRVDPVNDAAALVGDEPLLLAREAPTIIARDRRAGAAYISKVSPTSAVIVMDDGLQNPSLSKALTIAIVDGRRGLGNGRVLPAGPLRAPLAFQLGLVDAIVVTMPVDGAPPVDGPADRLRKSFPGPVLGVETKPAGDVAWLSEAKVAAFAGIANPERFFRLLAKLGAKVAVARAFADHHPLTALEATELMALARREEAVLVTTEKDQARLAGASGALASLRETAKVLAIRSQMPAGDEARLQSLLTGAIGDAG